jgi:hypothetical protein
MPVYFCIRDDDTSFFTSPEELEQVYGEISLWGPVSLAVVPFCRAGRSKGVPDSYRGRWSVHPLHENQALVNYLREGIKAGRFEAMLHGYYHDEPDGREEFEIDHDLEHRVREGRRYLEELLATTIRVFVAPRNTIGRSGLQAIARAGLHLGGVAGFRSGWPLDSAKAWLTWWRLRQWKKAGGVGVPWVLDLGDHREISGNPVTPLSVPARNDQAFEAALANDGVFCLATHYWEMYVPNVRPGGPTPAEQLHHLVERARSESRVVWLSVGDVLTAYPPFFPCREDSACLGKKIAGSL